MKHLLLYFLLMILQSLAGCAENNNSEKSQGTSDKIKEASKEIDENMKRSEQNQPLRHTEEEENIDGPYPADTYNFHPNGKFQIQAVYINGKDSTWMIFSSKTEDEILKKYSKLKVYKIRPTTIPRDRWLTIRQDCIRENMIFDISDKPKGWLLEHQARLK